VDHGPNATSTITSSSSSGTKGDVRQPDSSRLHPAAAVAAAAVAGVAAAVGPLASSAVADAQEGGGAVAGCGVGAGGVDGGISYCQSLGQQECWLALLEMLLRWAMGEWGWGWGLLASPLLLLRMSSFFTLQLLHVCIAFGIAPVGEGWWQGLPNL
jgi:hypothetical protein